ncbi:MAG: hypothetical protein A2879_02990 [Omnitrophica WOR_2 bacterium RIFCSPHIGHO2_01_FULL_49_10]|nr:MAG: hypothetical protein A2879_02990 [Omnitrophica WOR_2 bacterium RIFCSPHIGHO2_01_FULL_49_10]
MESIGSRIKSAREAKGISIDQAQKDTRISGRILSAIEADRAQEMISGPVYVKSFIKKYANYLGLDGGSLAESFTGKKPGSKEQISVLTKDEKPGRVPLKKIIYVAVAIVVIFLGIKLIVFAGSKTIAFFKSRPKVEKKIVTAKAAVKVPPQIPKGENLILSLKTRADVYLKVTSDGNVRYDGILKKGSSEKWEAKESFEISTSKAEALVIDLNGTFLGSLGKGAVKGLRLPK